eukprot:TRINITY_DN33717_c3_g1_i1.p2 TRINITY_DN33717_c3_g1~~TRINITY_DN33717_c3_g1_i1.p2  ORF type:complete len:146 (-),score=16.99 TRINITY_DN33717_c3_g1_i1:12-449(-)
MRIINCSQKTNMDGDQNQKTKLEQNQKAAARKKLIRRFKISDSMTNKPKTNPQQYKKALWSQLNENKIKWYQKQQERDIEQQNKLDKFQKKFDELQKEVVQWKKQYDSENGGANLSLDEIFEKYPDVYAKIVRMQILKTYITQHS